MKILTFASVEVAGSMEWAVNNIIDGAFVIDPSAGEQSADIAETCDELDKPMVLGFRWYKSNTAQIKSARGLTDQLALATSGLNEWSPMESVATWCNRAKAMDARWWCTYIHVRMLEDLRTFKVRDQLVEYNVPVVILCGYMLARYALGQSLPTYRSSLMDRNLQEDFGLGVDSLRAWLEPLEAYSGAGGQAGLERGTAISCERVGFKGIVCSGPFDMKKATGGELTDADPGIYKDLVDPTWR